MQNSFFVVEDHTLTNKGIRQLLLERENFSCAGFSYSKEETLRKISELFENGILPDILILDLVLGNDNGIEILQEVKSKYPSVKVLVYSMYSKPGIVSFAIEYGADGFVLKSAPEAEFFTALDHILNGETYIQPNLISPLLTYKTAFDGLTKQEQIIFRKIIERKSKQQILKELNIVNRSLDNYLSRIYMKIGCKNHEELIKKFGE